MAITLLNREGIGGGKQGVARPFLDIWPRCRGVSCWVWVVGRGMRRSKRAIRRTLSICGGGVISRLVFAARIGWSRILKGK